MDVRSKIPSRTPRPAGPLGAAGAYLAGSTAGSLIVVLLMAGFPDRLVFDVLIMAVCAALPGSIVGTGLAAVLARHDLPSVTAMPRQYYLAAYALAGAVLGPVITGATAFLVVLFMVRNS